MQKRSFRIHNWRTYPREISSTAKLPYDNRTYPRCFVRVICARSESTIMILLGMLAKEAVLHDSQTPWRNVRERREPYRDRTRRHSFALLLSIPHDNRVATFLPDHGIYLPSRHQYQWLSRAGLVSQLEGRLLLGKSFHPMARARSTDFQLSSRHTREFVTRPGCSLFANLPVRSLLMGRSRQMGYSENCYPHGLRCCYLERWKDWKSQDWVLLESRRTEKGRQGSMSWIRDPLPLHWLNLILVGTVVPLLRQGRHTTWKKEHRTA